MSENIEAPAPVVATAPVQPSSTMDNFRAGASDLAEQAETKFAVAADAVSDAADRAVDATRNAFDNAARRIRNNAELAADRGKTHIRHEVVEKIAGIAAREVPGVYDLGGDVARMFSAVKERIGLGDADADQGVKVTLEGRNAQIDVTIVIEFGYVVHSVTDTVRVKVINSVENLLGLEVTGVDVIVDDVHVDDDGPVGNDEARAADYVA
ncbi:putative alkaline shock family protein YloU [Hamadaea flava]|uniref:Asp23/Gls24 family envelope stress response protein n=1 Tax=Hamadaea flava TaxID=1742688 RepID=A0ABV8LJ20_9ACTN|nr:Asp23/Gls24 family envelope stress response protein [Hamadaea flava]MCP2325057.1 putative alkaline shock family protein YloU [Hamadaea flava]